MWRSYTIAKILFTIMQVEIINKKKFAMTILDLKDITFIIYIVFVIKLVQPS